MLQNKKITFLLSTSFILGTAMVASGFANLPESLGENNARGVKVAALPEMQTTAGLAPEKIIIEPFEIQKTVELKSGDTLAGILNKEGLDGVEVAYAVGEVNDVFDLRKLRAGQDIDLKIFNDNGKKNLTNLSFQPSIEKAIELKAVKENEFKAQLKEIPLEEVYVKSSGKIDNSFYASAKKAGVTDNVVVQLIAAMSYVVDFQRDVKQGQEFEILYKAYRNDEGEFLKGKRPVYFKLSAAKKDIEIYVIERENGSLGYYHPDGVSVKKGLLRTPIDGARLTSKFGMRKHPVLGYSRMHQGVDFGASRGTPIYAAGKGVVTFAGRKGSYGNFVKIKHNKTYSTAYAHASKFGRGIRKGAKVKQGQVIAYVGTTGRSTGPHLHYEVIKNGKQINPQNAKMPITDKLKGKKLKAFKGEVKTAQAAMKIAPTREALASLPSLKDQREAKSAAAAKATQTN